GVPCVLRAGHNFGHQYRYINPQTGCFATEATLPEKLLWVVENHHQFSPREWVMAHMSCQEGTRVMAEQIREKAVALGEDWTEGLAAKLSHLNAMHYWDPWQRQQFEPDYEFLRSALRGRPPAPLACAAVTQGA